MSLDFSLRKMVDSEIYTDNITHNLCTMASAAGLYQLLWRPEELGITHAEQMIVPLEEGLARLRADPQKFELFNPENGWGNYVGLVCFVNQLLQACQADPDARIHVSR